MRLYLLTKSRKLFFSSPSFITSPKNSLTHLNNTKNLIFLNVQKNSNAVYSTAHSLRKYIDDHEQNEENNCKASSSSLTHAQNKSQTCTSSCLAHFTIENSKHENSNVNSSITPPTTPSSASNKINNKPTLEKLLHLKEFLTKFVSIY
jgi:hypothetical protein